MIPSIQFLGAIFQLFQLDTLKETEPIILQTIPPKEQESKQKRIQLFLGEKKRLNQNWDLFFAKFGCSSAIIRSNKLIHLIRNGIPDQYRGLLYFLIFIKFLNFIFDKGFIWRFSCGSLYHIYQQGKNYQYYLNIPEMYRPAETIKQIERV